MKFFSKFNFICNVAFLLMIVLRFIEQRTTVAKSGDALIPVPAITGLLLTLGMLSIFLNLVFCTVIGVWLYQRKPVFIPRWMLIFSGTVLLVQLVYFLFV